MDKSWMYLDNRWSEEYTKGLAKFLKMARQKSGSSRKVRCPCRICRNVLYRSLSIVKNHLQDWGMDITYTVWRFHGEDSMDCEDEDNDNFSTCSTDDNLGDNDRFCTEEEIDSCDNDEVSDDEMQEILEDLYRGTFPDKELNEMTIGEGLNGKEDELDKFDKLFRASKRKLYPNCKRYSLLLFVVKLLHIKVVNRWSNKSVSMVLELFKDALPDNNLLPNSYYDARKLLADIGLGCETIHACKNDCVLFRNEYEGRNKCPECLEPRYKVDDGKGKQIPHKVLRHFPLRPRLHRLFMSRKTAEQMRWHKDKRVEEVGTLSHPADGFAWKDFDEKYPSFAEDPRSVRLALSSDGFNPFNNMSTAYSMWPVIVVNYNMPPWEARKESNFMLTLLIPGPRSPGKDIDVYLQPLIEELIELWNGVRAYDGFSREYFKMRTALLWTISDFPAYGELSGWVTKGKLACPCCKDETSFVSLRSKIGYLGHRRFLPKEHRWRRCASKFNGKQERQTKPKELSGAEILEQLEVVKDIKLGKNPWNKKRKRIVEERNWSKKSIFFMLPYWEHLKLPHNIDVMHTEKNWLESIMGTLLNIIGKNKDNDKARMDLKDMGIRPELHLYPKGEKYEKPSACYTLSPKEKSGFCNFLKSVKYPDGYAANISRCVNIKDGKISGLKSHDCHVLLQRMLAVGMRGYLKKEVYTLICEVAKFFQDLCSRKLRLDDVEKLEENIVIILCKMEMIFPPAFFDIMIHLAVHLPHQAKLGGPVQNRWMYPFERYLGVLKGTVKNKAHPEGSIAETYIVNESLTFCASYLDDVETQFSRKDRYYDGGSELFNRLSVFSNRVRPLGSAVGGWLTRDELSLINWYVLDNCNELRPYLIEHEEILKRDDHKNILGRQKEEFSSWLIQKIESLQCQESSKELNELYSLAQGADMRISKYSGCIVNGVKYLTSARDNRRKTQNSGIRVKGEHNNEIINFYGILKEVIELKYSGSHEVVLFKCDWFDSRYMQCDKFFTSINMKKQWYCSEPYILASQATQVFYVADTRLGGDWRIVQVVDHRHIWDPTLFESFSEMELTDHVSSSEYDSIYQQNECTTVVHEVQDFEVATLDRHDLEPEIVTIVTERGHSAFQTNLDDFIDDETEILFSNNIESDDDCFSFSSESDA